MYPMSLSEKPWFRRFLVTVAGGKHYKAFDRTSKDLRGTQEAVLKRMLDQVRNTAFGRDYSLASVKTIEDYRKAVPIGDFETHRPYVERMMRGERDVLFPGKPIIYNVTSGTTNKSKMIPISREYYEASVSSMNRLWLYSVMRDNPRIYDGKSLSAVSPAEEGVTEDGTPYGSVSGIGYRDIPNVLKSTYSFPYAVICIRDYPEKYYAMVRFALEHNITFIISPSPSNLIRFHQTVVDSFGDLVKDIRDGTLRQSAASGLPDEGRDEVMRMLKPNAARARELEKLMSTHGKELRPRHYWPNIACVNVWKQGNFALKLPDIEDYFGEQTVFRAFGYQASEGRLGLVLNNDWDYSVLAHYVYHVEFIDVAERDSEQPRTLQAHEVEKGKRYFVVFTNGSGLFRYDINDMVEIVDFYNQVPLFRFLQKGEGVTSLTGEKLSELQAIDAVAHAARTCSTDVRNYVLCCDEAAMKYRLFAEFHPETPKDTKRAFMKEFDNRLCAINREYEAKRHSERLEAPDLRELCYDSYELLKQRRIANGMGRAGQYKDIYLTNKPALIHVLESLPRQTVATD
ncbi:MAG: auxin-responsive protein [Chitinivibrionales bacterium]|nr:auxin-responsive protein [Chitinivibrionales bacterium]